MTTIGDPVAEGAGEPLRIEGTCVYGFKAFRPWQIWHSGEPAEFVKPRLRNCCNCGAPGDGDSDKCLYCGSER